MNKPTLSKGDLVKTIPNDKFPMSSGVNAWRRLNAAELQAWRDSPDSKGMTCDGETKLPPRDKGFRLEQGTLGVVIRARVAAPDGWGTASGCCQIYFPEMGETLYLHRSRVSRA